MNIAQVAVLEIDKEALLLMLGLPTDTVIIDTWCEAGDPTKVNHVWLKLASADFPPVEVGEDLPEANPTLKIDKAILDKEKVDVIRLVSWGLEAVEEIATK